MSKSQNRPVQVVINQSAFAHNLRRVKTLTPNANVMAVIKADGYGHNMEAAAAGLQAADEFAVNSLDDVQRLRAHGITKRLTLLSSVFDFEQLVSMAPLNVCPVIYDWSQLPLLEQLPADVSLAIWLKVDTGMGRLGFSVSEFSTVTRRVKQCKGIESISLMTHLANADQVGHADNQKQLNQFAYVASMGDYSTLSVLNSAGVVNFPDAANTVVRPGIMLYGISPIPNVSASELEIEPVMTFKSELISVKPLPAGSAIGYGGDYILDQDSRIGIVACGYGDGYPRSASHGTPVLVNGVIVPLVGRVSMDMIVVDLGELPASVGDSVILWGKGNPIEDVAKYAGTIPYELSCGILPRVERVIV